MMATQEKLQKSLVALRNSKSNDSLKKKEKIQHCYTVTEAISNPTIRISTNYLILLGNTIETFLQLCDDHDSDIRMTSEECLNRVIRATNDGHIGKIQIELHKEIKKNGPARSLRAALWLFSILAHHIRPHKGKPYVTSLFPSLSKISERTEESVHETLALSLPRILKVLGCFTTENEMKIFLKSVLKNIPNESAAIRRTTTTNVLTICMNCRKPSVFLNFCLGYLLDLMVPIGRDQTNFLILGAMNCIKFLIPEISKTESKTENQDLQLGHLNEKLLQVFELCIHFLTYQDHNIVNVCLETMSVLFQHTNDELKKALLNERGLGQHSIHTRSKSALSKPRSPSELSIATTVATTDDNVFSESELTETIHTDIEKWIDESKLSVFSSGTVDRSRSLNTVSITEDNHETASDEHFEKLSQIHAGFVSKLTTHSIGDNLDSLNMSENSSEKSFSASTEDNLLHFEDAQEIDIGDILDFTPPLVYCIRLVAKQFLLKDLPGTVISDKSVRVSVKYLALSCLSSIFELYPRGIFLYLDKNYSKMAKHRSSQNVAHILIFKKHSDPQLRGAVRNLLATFIKTVCVANEESYEEWINRCGASGLEHEFLGEEMTKIFMEGLNDESSACVRQTLISLDTVLPYISEFYQNTSTINLLNMLPLLAKNPYWLVKVSLCELIAKIDYAAIFYLINTTSFQDKVIFNILFELLSDCDQRVRSSAASATVDIIPRLYLKEYKVNEDVTTFKGISLTEELIHILKITEVETNVNKKHFIEQMPFPFSVFSKQGCDKIEFSLSKIIYRLCNIITSSTSKHLINGCIETLCRLSEAYPTTVYKESWGIFNKFEADALTKSMVPDLLKLCTDFLLDTDYIYDLQAHINLLHLAASLYAGHALSLVNSQVDTETSTDIWAMFSVQSFCNISERFLEHSFKLLNVYHHVLNELIPVHSQSKTVLSSFSASSTLSPIKRRKSDLDKKTLIKGKMEKDEKMDKKESTKCLLGVFANSPRYMKIFDILKGAHMNYKVSLDSDSCQTFVELLKATIRSLSILMEIGTLTEFSRIAEDMLLYFHSTFSVVASMSVKGVQQLLKCLFGTNLTANILEFNKTFHHKQEENVEGLYQNVFQKPYNLIVQFVSMISNSDRDLDDDSTVMGYLHRKDIKKRSIVLSRSSDKILANYIRIFEPMVIKSLKQYTITSNVDLQCEVLQLLSQLVQLRVNYCLLDSEQVFIGFVLRQFEFIEGGQVPFAENLIPKIFHFLVQLSYSKQHSKCIISIPKIIHLCDGLMASGQPSITHCIPALEPIVEDIFLTRNKSNTTDIQELETTREVILSMLLRLWEYEKVLDLISLILEDSKFCIDNCEKWYEWSKRVFSLILPAFKQSKVKLDKPELFISMKRLFHTLNPEVFQPFDDVIVIFFQEPPPKTADVTLFNSWLSKIILLLFIIISIKEDILLSNINRLKSEFSPACIYENVITKADPLNVNNNADTFDKIPEELIFVRFLFRVIALLSEKCLLAIKNVKSYFLLHQLSLFLLQCSFLFQSGKYCRITQTAVSLLNENIPFDECDVQISVVNKNFKRIHIFYPILTNYWCYFLTLLNYNDKSFYSSMLECKDNSNKDRKLRCSSINLEISRIWTLITLCDFMVENMDTENIIWLLSMNSKSLVDLCEECPVAEFISAIHRNSTFSKLFIKNIGETITCINSFVYKSKALRCIEHCHITQIGTILKLLIPNMLKIPQAAISKQAAKLAGEKIQVLLNLPLEEFSCELSKEDLMAIQKNLISLNLVHKYETLVGLLNQLSTRHYNLMPIEFEQKREVNPNYIKKLKINKKWYLSQIQERYNDENIGKETAELLSQLEFNEIISFMSSSGFNKLCLRDCLKITSKNDKGYLGSESDIVKASIECLWKDIGSISARIPEVQRISYKEMYSSPLTDSCNMLHFFQNEDILDIFHSVAPCIPLFLSKTNLNISDRNLDSLMKFGILSLEYTNLLIQIDPSDCNINSVDIFLNSANEIFKRSKISHLLELENNISYFCHAVDYLFRLVNELLLDDKPLPSIPNAFLQENENSFVNYFVHNLYILVCWFHDLKCVNTTKIPDILFDPLQSLTISLSRLSVAYSYNMVPLKAWKNGWTPETVSGNFKTQIPLLPIELLQDVDMLEEYIFRIKFIGWTSRQQFEETWMCLLSVLCYQTDNVDPLELSDILHSSSVAIQSITTLLMQTLTCSDAGNPNLSNFIHISRDLPLTNDNIGIKKLKKIQDALQLSYNEYSSIHRIELPNVFEPSNFEKSGTNYSYGQVSIKYFLMMIDTIKEVENNSEIAEICKRRKKMLEDCGLDVNSCLQFLLDYYAQLMKPQSSTHLKLLHEALKSTLTISDLFTDKSQFSWMLEMFLGVLKRSTVEDELLHQYLIMGICKAVGVLTPEMEIYEKLKKILVQYLKSSYLSTRIACLHGLLYVVEGCKLNNNSDKIISDEMQLILPCAVEYVQSNLETSNSMLKKSQEHSNLVWSLAFYLIENIDEINMEQNFVFNTLSVAFSILNTSTTGPQHYSIMKRLERLLIVKKDYFLENFGKQYLRLTFEKIKNDSPTVALLGTQLLLTYMYTVCIDHLQSIPNSSNVPTNPDQLVQTIEKISALFDRIKKGYVYEVEILCSILPNILDDFFSPSDILTKVIQEFLSPQQPHPKMLSKVVFQVFQSAINKDQLTLLRDWVVFSLSNFIQSFSVNMATWCLTCFFISASSNGWLRAYFPYVQARVGRYEYEDKKMFCIAGADFYHSLTSDKQKQTFVETFKNVRGQPDTPFNDLLLSL